MKPIIATFLIVFIVMSCNLKDKESTTSKITHLKQVDTIKSILEPHIKITKPFVLGKFNYRTDTTFTKVSTEHATKTLFLNKDVYNAFLKMNNAAKLDNVKLIIMSGTRNYEEQKAIWERKWKKHENLEHFERAQKILEYSSMPSSSRHHWGTDLDLNSLSNSYFSSGNGLKEYEWLKANANDYGFYQVYTEKNENRTGYNLEKWHWSYLPLASKYLKFYNENVDNTDITGFSGSEQAEKLKIINDYVNGISKKAKDYK